MGIPQDGNQLEVHVFAVTGGYTGEPKETDEMRPSWFAIDNIPFDQVGPDSSPLSQIDNVGLNLKMCSAISAWCATKQIAFAISVSPVSSVRRMSVALALSLPSSRCLQA